MSHSFEFSGKIVWITSAGQGIGYHTALAFHQAGAQIEAFDQRFHGHDYPFPCHTLDVSDPEQVKTLCQRLLAAQPRIDCWLTPPVFCGLAQPMSCRSPIGRP